MDDERLAVARRKVRGRAELRFDEFRTSMENEITDPYERLILYSVIATKSKGLVLDIGKEIEGA